MRQLPKQKPDENVLLGVGHADDGAVYQLTEDIALIQTVDFFTPIVDDPYEFGQIAAANSLSDVDAVGGKPRTVLNIVGFTIQTLGPDILAEILRGSADKVEEAGATVVGGHSIDDQEPKFGLSVTGTVHPQKFFTNHGAQVGDKLILTKPIGIGIQTTALKRGQLSKDQISKVTEIMSTLNKDAAERLTPFKPHAVTDVTGFGLLGHAYEMAKQSDVSLTISHQKVPVLPHTYELAEDNIFPGGTIENVNWLADKVNFHESVTTSYQRILCDAITSGRLLISLPEEKATQYVQSFNKFSPIKAEIIGEVKSKREKFIHVI